VKTSDRTMMVISIYRNTLFSLYYTKIVCRFCIVKPLQMRANLAQCVAGIRERQARINDEWVDDAFVPFVIRH
jgi:hypothetical protein